MAIVSILLTSQPNDRIRADTAAPAADGAVSQTSKAGESFYTLKEYNKRLAVYEDGKSEPIYISGVFVSELPKADRDLIKNGIPAHSEKELRRLLEDYCS